MSTPTYNWLWRARAPSDLLTWLRNPAIQIALLGSLTWLCYLHLTLSYPLPELVARYPLTDFGKANHYTPAALADFLLSIFGAFSLYLTAWQIAARHPQDGRLQWPILAVAALAAVTLLFMYPITATDLFDYLFHSRIFVHYGQNPLVVAPSAFANDSLLRFVTWRSQPTPYGALWVLLTAPGSRLAGDNLVLNLYFMKGLVVVAHLGAALLVWAILGRLQPAHQLAGTLLFAWNPLVLFETAGNGHNDMLMMFFALLAVYLLARRQWVWVLPALLAAALVKYAMVLLLLPFFIYLWHVQVGWRRRLRFTALTTGLCLLLVGMVAPFYWPLPRGLARETDFYSLLAVSTLVFSLVKGTTGEQKARAMTVVVSLATYGPVYALSLRRVARLTGPRQLAVWSTGLVATYLVLACMQFQPWFAVWPIALGLWMDNTLLRRLLLVFTASVLSSYAANFLWNWHLHEWAHLQVNAMFVGVIFGPPLLFWLAALAKGWRVGLLAAWPAHRD